MFKRYNAVLAFSPTLSHVWLVQKNRPDMPHIHRLFSGIGGEMEVGESPVGSAMREFTEETGYSLNKDDMVHVEHQRFLPGHEIYWYATVLGERWQDFPLYNDAGEFMNVFDCNEWGLVPVKNWGSDKAPFAPNLTYLVPKALTLLRTPYTARPM